MEDECMEVDARINDSGVACTPKLTLKKKNFVKNGMVNCSGSSVGKGSSNVLSTSGVSLLRALRKSYNEAIAGGHELEALEALLQACRVKGEVFGQRSKWTRASELDFVKCANVLGTNLIRKGRLEEGSRVLLDAHKIACCDVQTEAATLINISACMYSQELLEDALKYLAISKKSQRSCVSEISSECGSKKKRDKTTKAGKAKEDSNKSVFRAEAHLNTCAAQYKLGDCKRALFHAQCAVKFAQDQVRQYASQTLPECFQREAFVTLALSYHALATSLRTYGFNTLKEDTSFEADSAQLGTRQDATSSIKLEGFACILSGIKFHIKSFEDMSKANAEGGKTSIPLNLLNGLWLVFTLACAECSDMAQNVLDQGKFLTRPDLVFLCKVIMQQVAAGCIQRRTRGFLLKRKTRAALYIQSYMNKYLKIRREQTNGAAKVLQARFRGHTARKEHSQLRVRAAEVRKRKLEQEERANAKANANVKGEAARENAVVKQQAVKKKNSSHKKLRTTPKAIKLNTRDAVLLAASIDQWKQIRQYELRVSFSALKRNRERFLRRQIASAARIVQAQWRGHRIRNDFKQLRSMATTIQSSYREHAQRKSNKIKKMTQSIMFGIHVVAVQDWWRSKLTSRKTVRLQQEHNMRQKEKRAAVKIQSHARGRMLRKAIADEEVAFDGHVVKIQSWIRGKQTRGNLVAKQRHGNREGKYECIRSTESCL